MRSLFSFLIAEDLDTDCEDLKKERKKERRRKRATSGQIAKLDEITHSIQQGGGFRLQAKLLDIC